MAEVWRRLVLLSGITVSVCMIFYADFSSRVSFESVNFAKKQKNQTRFLTGKEIPRNSSSRKAELVVMKIRTNQ